jgi:hypothetical protein
MATSDGKVNLDAMLSRKPLYPTERNAAPSRICVTGEQRIWQKQASARLPGRP